MRTFAAMWRSCKYYLMGAVNGSVIVFEATLRLFEVIWVCNAALTYVIIYQVIYLLSYLLSYLLFIY